MCCHLHLWLILPYTQRAVHASTTVTVTHMSRCLQAYLAYCVFALFTLDLMSLEEGETSRPVMF
jgi:hypothetical protein